MPEPENIDVNVVIEQLINKIAQLELEVAILKAMIGSPLTAPPVSGEKPEHNGGYV